jgi:general stress protein YciG
VFNCDYSIKKPTIKHRKNNMKHQALEDSSKLVTVQEAGRRGGQATFQNHGVRHFKKIGRKGGRRTAELYRELLSDFGKRGGRPRRPSLRESMEEGDLQ